MIIAANFKMTHTRAQTAAYLKEVDQFMAGRNDGRKAYVFPPFTALDAYECQQVTVGAQNGYPKERGSFTGEIGLEQFEEFGIKTILLGHSERRHVIGETQELIAQKYDFFKTQGFEIFYCIGEPLEVKEQGLDAVMEYNYAQLQGIDLGYDKLVVAYEPVWAIGTGKSATPEDIREIHAKLREKIAAPLLYGGSVKPATIAETIAIDNVDGALIGTASWEAKDFCSMLGC